MGGVKNNPKISREKNLGKSTNFGPLFFELDFTVEVCSFKYTCKAQKQLEKKKQGERERETERVPLERTGEEKKRKAMAKTPKIEK